MTAALRVENLSVVSAEGNTRILSDINFAIEPGQVVGLIGESGSGKTTIGLSALGYLRHGLRPVSGRVLLGDVDVLKLDEKGLRELRGNRVAYVAQSAAAAFNPCLSIDRQVTEPLLEHGIVGAREARQRAIELYKELELPRAEQIGERFPHEVSGGQLQRLMAAMAIGTGPELIVFDEPTTALDVTTQVQVLRAFKRVIQHHKMAAIYISHDLPVVSQIADVVIVLRNGQIVEAGKTADVLMQPRDNYTRNLLRACKPVVDQDARVQKASAQTKQASDVLLSGTGLVAGFEVKTGGRTSFVKAVDNVSFRLRKGKVLGVIGESGSGKSTLARVVAGLVPRQQGDVMLSGQALSTTLKGRSHEQMRRIQIVFQSADTSLNPKHTIGTILGRVATQLFGLSRSDALDAARKALETVQLPASFVDRYPQQLSGGQKQRVNLARALIAKPDVVICDEVTSALDPLIREQIIELLQQLKATLGLSMIFISHDISTIAALADDVIVMLKGEPVEQGALEDVLDAPQHPYTRNLIGSVPQLRPGWLEEMTADR